VDPGKEGEVEVLVAAVGISRVDAWRKGVLQDSASQDRGDAEGAVEVEGGEGGRGGGRGGRAGFDKCRYHTRSWAGTSGSEDEQ